MYTNLKPDDVIVLNSVESYLNKSNVLTSTTTPEQQMRLYGAAQKNLYGSIAQRLPRLSRIIIFTRQNHDNTNADSNTNVDMRRERENKIFQDRVNAIYLAIKEIHSKNADFVDYITKAYMENRFTQDDALCIGALFGRILNDFAEELESKKNSTSSTKDKKKGTTETTTSTTVEEDTEIYKKLLALVKLMLRNVIDCVTSRYPSINEYQAIGIAAVLALNDENTAAELIASDIPVTADVLDVIYDNRKSPSNAITGALKLESVNYSKVTPNQMEFINSLKTYVYRCLSSVDNATLIKYLIAVYGSVKPDTQKYLINLRDASNKQYPKIAFAIKTLLG